MTCRIVFAEPEDFDHLNFYFLTKVGTPSCPNSYTTQQNAIVFQGWHSVTDPLPLPDDFGHAYLEMFSPFLARVTAIMKYNKTMKFQYLEEELGQDYLKWLEEVRSTERSEVLGIIFVVSAPSRSDT